MLISKTMSLSLHIKYMPLANARTVLVDCQADCHSLLQGLLRVLIVLASLRCCYTHVQLPYWEPPVLQVSSRTGKGVMAVWEAVEQFTNELSSRGQLDARRRSQGR
jgi:Methylmalonyl Co-A mutase-associated GTPase MeaB